MASISDLILSQVKSATGGIEIPSDLKDKVFGGMSESIADSLTQTAARSGGIEDILSLLKGEVSAEKSPVTALAGNLFDKNVLSKLGLGDKLSSALKGVIPSVTGKLGKIFSDRDGDGDVDLNDILLALKGGLGGGLLSAAGSILGGLFGRK